jgi:hypothetical protein
VPTVVFEELIIIVTYLLACNLVVQHVVSCNWVLPVGNIFIIIIIIIIIVPNAFNYLKNVKTWEQCSVEL